MAHVRQSRPVGGIGVVLKTFQVVPSSLRSYKGRNCVARNRVHPGNGSCVAKEQIGVGGGTVTEKMGI